MSAPSSFAYRIDEGLYDAFCRFTYRRSIARCMIPAVILLGLLAVVLLVAGEDLIDAVMPAIVMPAAARVADADRDARTENLRLRGREGEQAKGNRECDFHG